jgi:hypothetical protein
MPSSTQQPSTGNCGTAAHWLFHFNLLIQPLIDAKLPLFLPAFPKRCHSLWGVFLEHKNFLNYFFQKV